MFLAGSLSQRRHWLWCVENGSSKFEGVRAAVGARVCGVDVSRTRCTMGWTVSRVRMPRPSGSLRVPTSPLLPSSPSFASLRLLAVLGPCLAQSPPLFCHFPYVVTDLEPSLSAPFGRRDNARPAVFAPLHSPSKRFCTACGPGASSLIFFAFLRLHSAPRYH